MTAPKIIISPKTKVGELLEAYPALESVLMSMSPAFEKLRNPVLPERFLNCRLLLFLLP